MIKPPVLGKCLLLVFKDPEPDAIINLREVLCERLKKAGFFAQIQIAPRMGKIWIFFPEQNVYGRVSLQKSVAKICFTVESRPHYHYLDIPGVAKARWRMDEQLGLDL